MRCIKRLLLLSLLCICLSTHAAGEKPPWTTIDAELTAHYEVAMWRAYYSENYIELWRLLVKFFAYQLDINVYHAARISFYATTAAMGFAQMPANMTEAEVNQAVLPHLRKFYQEIKTITHSTWSVEAVAQAELDWWQTRRANSNDQVSVVANKITKLYSLLYNGHNDCLEKAAFYRANAAKLRDKQRLKQYINWLQLKQQLQLAYRWLNRGIQGCNGFD